MNSFQLHSNALTDEATLAGWKIDTLKISDAAGERKPIKVNLSVPEVPPSSPERKAKRCLKQSVAVAYGTGVADSATVLTGGGLKQLSVNSQHCEHHVPVSGKQTSYVVASPHHVPRNP